MIKQLYRLPVAVEQVTQTVILNHSPSPSVTRPETPSRAHLAEFAHCLKALCLRLVALLAKNHFSPPLH